MKLLSSVITSLLLLGSTTAWQAVASVSVTPASGGDAISADSAAGSFTSLDGPSIAEESTGAISTGTIVLNAPSGFIFDTNAPVSVAISGGTGTDIALASTNATVETNTITITVTAPSASAGQSTLTWSGISVRATAGTPLVSGTMTRSGTAATTESDLTASNYGALAEIPGAASQIIIQTQPSSSATAGVELTQQPVVRLEDQFGNICSNDNSTQITASRNEGSGTL